MHIKNKIKPIIVIGMNRSGTKWLSNLVSNHESVYSVQQPHHQGILETNVLWKFPKKIGPIDNIENFISFVEIWAQTDFFKASGLDKDFLYQLKPRPKSYYEVFRVFMEELAKKNNCSYWLQKTFLGNYQSIVKNYPDAKILIIKRKYIDVLKSTIKALSNIGYGRSLFRAALSYRYEEICINRLKKVHKNIFYITYEELKKDTVGQLHKIYSFLSLNYDSKYTEIKFDKNTSFKDKSDYNKSFNKTAILKLKVFRVFSILIPKFLVVFLFRLIHQYRQPNLHGRSFALIQKEKKIL